MVGTRKTPFGRALSTLTALAMSLSVFMSFGGVSVSAAPSAVPDMSGHSHSGWTPIRTQEEFKEALESGSGKYYLDCSEDVFGYTWRWEGAAVSVTGDVTLCLNGKMLRPYSTYTAVDPLFEVSEGACLSICDEGKSSFTFNDKLKYDENGTRTFKGVIYHDGDCALVKNNGTFSTNGVSIMNANGSGIVNSATGTVNISNGSMLGGGKPVENSGVFNMVNVDMGEKNNSAFRNNKGAELNMYKSKIRDTSCYESSGYPNNGTYAVYNLGTVRMTDSELTGNQHNCCGAGIYNCEGSEFIMKGGKLSDNAGGCGSSTGSKWLGYEGGAVCAEENCTVKIDGVEISGNVSGGRGSVICAYDGCDIEINNCSITENGIMRSSGSVRAVDILSLGKNTTLKMDNNVIDSNKGKVIYPGTGSDVKLTNLTMTNNSGRLVSISDSDVIIKNCTATDNTCDNCISLSNCSNAEISDLTVTGNTSDLGIGLSLGSTVVKISGKINVTGNKDSEGDDRNCRLTYGALLDIVGDVTGSSIGVHTNVNLDDCRTGKDELLVTTPSTADYRDIFTSDRTGSEVLNKDADGGGSQVMLHCPHNIGTEWEYNKTHHWHKCQRFICKEECDKEEHDFSDWEIIKTPSIPENGLLRRICICGHLEEKTLYHINVESAGNGIAELVSPDPSTPWGVEGDPVKIRVVPDEGYYFLKWTTPISRGFIPTGDEFVIRRQSVNIKAHFTNVAYNLKVENDGNGEAYANATGLAEENVTSAKIAANNTVSLKAVPKRGFVFDHWEVSPSSVTVSASNTLKMPAEGDTVTLTAVPDKGYEFDKWVSDDVTVGTDDTFTMIASDVVVTAQFKPIEYTVTVKTDGNGTASADKETAGKGDTVTLTAVPDEGYVFDKWVSDNVTVGTDDTFTMPADDVTVTAVFKTAAKGHNITAGPFTPGTGEVHVYVDGKETSGAYADTEVTLSAEPAEGYIFDHWESKFVRVSDDKFIMPDMDVVIRAIFVPVIYNITVTADIC